MTGGKLGLVAMLAAAVLVASGFLVLSRWQCSLRDDAEATRWSMWNGCETRVAGRWQRDINPAFR